jgi:nucleotide-binding universal stress UspA family protein
MQLTNILVPIDFSPHSLHALRIAGRIAAERGAALDILHVWQPLVAFTTQSPPAVVLAAQEQAARAQLEQLPTEDYGTTAHPHLSTGAAADEIIHFAESRRSDLIVMGTYGCSGLRPYVGGQCRRSSRAPRQLPGVDLQTSGAAQLMSGHLNAGFEREGLPACEFFSTCGIHPRH